MDYKQEKVYEHGMWKVIKRTSEYGVCFSVVRYGSAFFERTFATVGMAINWIERQE